MSAAPTEPHEVAFASGAALCIRRAVWSQAGGFDPSFFMYCEDLDLSFRLRLAGWGIGVDPAARVEHDYEFRKGSQKWLLLERNRWWTVVATYPAPLLGILAPALVVAELGLLAVAARDGWLEAKLRSEAEVLRSLRRTLARRRQVQAERTTTTTAFAAWLTGAFDSPYAPALPRPIDAAQAAAWRMIRFGLRVPRQPAAPRG